MFSFSQKAGFDISCKVKSRHVLCNDKLCFLGKIRKMSSICLQRNLQKKMQMINKYPDFFSLENQKKKTKKTWSYPLMSLRKKICVKSGKRSIPLIFYLPLLFLHYCMRFSPWRLFRLYLYLAIKGRHCLRRVCLQPSPTRTPSRMTSLLYPSFLTLHQTSLGIWWKLLHWKLLKIKLTTTWEKRTISSRKHACIVLTPLKPTFIQ